MKKILLLIIILLFVLSQQSYSLQVNLLGRYTVYFNIYKNLYPIEISYDGKNLVYHNKIHYKEIINYLEKQNKRELASITKAGYEMWNFSKWHTEIYYLTNLDQYNPEWLAKIKPLAFFTEKEDMILNKAWLKEWVNYIVACAATNLKPSDFSTTKIPFKYAYCSEPKEVYKLNEKIYLNKEDYLKAKEELENKEESKYNYYIDLLKKRLDYKWFDGNKYVNFIEDYTKTYLQNKVWNNYKPLDNLTKWKLLTEIYNNLINKERITTFFNWKPLYWLVSKEDVKKIVNKVWNDYFQKLDQQYYNKINQKEQYKQEAIWNYAQLKQEYENYKKLTAENRQKAIKLTITLTKIVSKYHTKQEKLAILDKVDEIIATKYSPDKFKNQDLIWYVKDYLKIIRLAIELSE